MPNAEFISNRLGDVWYGTKTKKTESSNCDSTDGTKTHKNVFIRNYLNLKRYFLILMYRHNVLCSKNNDTHFKVLTNLKTMSELSCVETISKIQGMERKAEQYCL